MAYLLARLRGSRNVGAPSENPLSERDSSHQIHTKFNWGEDVAFDCELLDDSALQRPRHNDDTEHSSSIPSIDRGSICRHCKDSNMKQLFEILRKGSELLDSPAIAPGGGLIFDNLWPSGISHDTKCSICQFFYLCAKASLPSNYEPDFASIKVHTANPQRYPKTDYKTLPAAFEFGGLFLKEGKEQQYLGGVVIAGSHGLLHGNVIQAKVDGTVLRAWFDDCRGRHRIVNDKTPINGQGDKSFQVPGLRLIDCVSKKIVEARPTMTYVALSYVWGSTKSLATSAIGSETLLELPKVVEDAITVTLMLGMRFLWVDRYCIPSDKTEKHLQIMQMDSIYKGAEITIIAAAKSDSSEGLSGVSMTRPIQPVLDMGGLTLTWTFNDPTSEIRQSVWNTRGWTYQEARLSKRRLFFTEKQVYYECDRTCRRQETIGNNYISRMHVNHRHYDCIWEIDRAPMMEWAVAGSSNIWRDLEAYTSRFLTFESDALNAMLGLFRASRNDETDPLRHICGVPFRLHSILDDSRREFLRALLWTLKRPGSRRPDFPSWSWTGWRSPVHSVLPIDFQRASRPIPSSETAENTGLLDVIFGHEMLVQVDLEKQDGSRFSWEEMCEHLRANKHLPLAPVLRLTGPKFFTRFTYLAHDPNVEQVPTLDLLGMCSKPQTRYHGWWMAYSEEGKEEVFAAPAQLNVDMGDADVDTRLRSQEFTCVVTTGTNILPKGAIIIDETHDPPERIGTIYFERERIVLTALSPIESGMELLGLYSKKITFSQTFMQEQKTTRIG